jgi:hypothetical protein
MYIIHPTEMALKVSSGEVGLEGDDVTAFDHLDGRSTLVFSLQRCCEAAGQNCRYKDGEALEVNHNGYSMTVPRLRLRL